METIDIQILEEPLRSGTCEAFVGLDAVGGIVTFVGTVRNQTQGRGVLRLDFESYVPMAIKEMKKIAVEAMEKFGVLRISMHHRVGSLKVGELAVVISVSAPHRKAAFSACEYAIDTLKQTVPIWKKEVFEDGEVWVAAHP